MAIFNEQSLREEIKRVWGEYGAHMIVYDELMRRASVLNPKEPEAVHGNEAGKKGCEHVWMDEKGVYQPKCTKCGRWLNI